MPQEILTTEFQDRSHQPLGHPSIPLEFIIVLYYLASFISRPLPKSKKHSEFLWDAQMHTATNTLRNTGLMIFYETAKLRISSRVATKPLPLSDRSQASRIEFRCAWSSLPIRLAPAPAHTAARISDRSRSLRTRVRPSSFSNSRLTSFSRSLKKGSGFAVTPPASCRTQPSELLYPQALRPAGT